MRNLKKNVIHLIVVGGLEKNFPFHFYYFLFKDISTNNDVTFSLLFFFLFFFIVVSSLIEIKEKKNKSKLDSPH